MKISNMNRLKAILTLVLAGVCIVLNAQSNNPGYFSTSQSLQGVGTGSSNIPSGSASTFALSPVDKTHTAAQLLREKNKSAKLLLKLDFGNDYAAIPSASFSINVNLIITVGATIFTKNLTVTENTPEVLQTIDLLSIISGATTISVQVSAPTVAPTPSGLLLNYINNNLRVSTTLVREYGVDVRISSTGIMSGEPIVSNVGIANRLVTFNWLPNSVDEYPNYELQILKLNNTDETLQNDQNQIGTRVDWSKALKVETQSSNHSVNLTMAEGTGFYIWRVRPIGTYFDGGIANSENYGKWSNSSLNNVDAVFNKNTLTPIVNNPTPYAFYFTDPDENINWIYNRTFAEGDNENQANATGTKVSEGMNYADGLLRARQSQAFNSSNNTTIVSQTVSDYSGRPALTTLPVPVNSGLTGYKVGFVKTTSGNIYTSYVATEHLYTAADYDHTDPSVDPLYTNADHPSTIKDAAGSAFSYYSDNAVTLNSDANNNNVPNAEGYAFKRTKFKSDGTGRVEEESGVGKVHSLGTITNGSVRTTRVLYGTPSDDELIRIFGEEAPLAESVIKTTTIDPNNVVSVSYTSKEGKTIATALISESADNLMTLKKAATSLPVSNVADQNMVSAGKFVSSRRINIPLDATSITLNYQQDGMPSPSGCPSGNCNFKLKFYLVDIKNGNTYISDADNGITGFQSFDPASNPFTTFPDWEFRTKDNALVKNHNTTTNNITLNAGEYLFIKEVYSDNGENYVESVINTQTDQYQPILNAIADKMAAATTPAAYILFTNFMTTLSGQIAGYPSTVTTAELLTTLGLTAGNAPTDDVPADYVFPADFVLDPITSTQGATSEMSFSTGCCGTMKAQIPKPDICFACEGSPNIVSPVTTMDAMITANSDSISAGTEILYGINDIFGTTDFQAISESDPLVVEATKREKIDAIVQYYFIDLLTDKMAEEGILQTDLYKIAPGFTVEGMKFMISNMLISKYYTGNAVKGTDNLWYTGQKNITTGLWEASSTLISAVPLELNYQCKDLLVCWTNAVNLLNSFENSDDVNIVSAFNDEPDGGPNSAQNEGDDEDNYEELSKRQKRKLKKAVSIELEEFSDSDDGKVPKSKIEAVTSVVANFMDCAGYKFAAIIDGDLLPGYIADVNTDNIPDDYSVSAPAGNSPPPSSVLTSITIAGTSYSAPILINDWTIPTPFTITCPDITNPSPVLSYPYIVKPEWMFKYFVYNVFHSNNTTSEYIDDYNALIPNQVMVDLKQGYNNAGYYTVPAAITLTSPVCNYTFDDNHLHQNWSMEERMLFYSEIKGSAACYKTKGDASTTPIAVDPPVCEKCDLINAANAELDSYQSTCEGKGPEIKAALIAELEASCYTIVECQKTTVAGEVTEKEIDLMVAAVIENCTTQVASIRTKLPTTDGATCSGGSSSYGCVLATEWPFYKEEACSEILLKDDNTLYVEENVKIEIELFKDCDRKLLSMLSAGTFIPHIPPNPNVLSCPSAKPNEWEAATCSQDPGCNGEKVDCTGTGTNFSTYSAEQPIEATQ